MWRILKAEFQYNIYLVLIPSLFVVTAATANLVMDWSGGQTDLYGTKTVMVTMTFIILFLRLIKYHKESRDRQVALVPIPRLKAGLARQLFLLIIWTTYLLMFWLSSSTVSPKYGANIWWHTLSVTGFILIVNAFSFIYRDLLNIFTFRAGRLVLTIIFVITMAAGYLLFIFLAAKSTSFEVLSPVSVWQSVVIRYSKSPAGSIFYLLSGLLFSLFGLWVYRSRKIFIE